MYSGFVWAIHNRIIYDIIFVPSKKDMPQITPFVWLAIGGVFATLCLGRGTVALAAWLAPIFLLRFARVMPPVALYLNRRLWPFTALNSWTGGLSIGLNSWKHCT